MVEDMVGWYGLDDSYSSLFPNIGDDDPENSFSSVPYEKGSQFMFYIESLIGPTAMQAYLRDYITEFHGMAINSPELKVFYEAWVTANLPDNATEILEMTMWDTWIYEPGVAPVPLEFYTIEIDRGQNLAREYMALASLNETDADISRSFQSPVNYEQYFDYYGSQKLGFVQELRAMEGVNAALLAHIDNDLNISLGEPNPDTKNEWYVLSIEVGYETAMEPAYVWTGSQGRSAFVRPVFDALVDNGMCETAIQWCEDYCTTYNIYVSSRVESAIAEGCSGGDVEDDGDGTDPGTGGDDNEDGGPGSGQQSNVIHTFVKLLIVGSVLSIL
jgi:leukotriene-A4 hydrolase